MSCLVLLLHTNQYVLAQHKQTTESDASQPGPVGQSLLSSYVQLVSGSDQHLLSAWFALDSIMHVAGCFCSQG